MDKQNHIRLCNTKTKICLTGLLTIIFLVSCYYCVQKSGYFVDEGMTLFLANARYNGAVTTQSEYGFGDFLSTFVWKDTISDTVLNIYEMLQQVITAGNYSKEGTVEWYDAARKMLQGESVWIDGDALFREITVPRDDRFRYGQVYLNQMMDVHPPLYYIIVHTVFSLFAGHYSKVFLFGINIVYLIMTCIFLFKTVKIFWHNTPAAFLAVLLYGFSCGFLTCSVFFRMYAMETFWVMLTLYTHLQFKYDDSVLKGKNRVFLILPVILGFWTHYYYILYMLPLFVITCLYFLCKKQKARMIAYIKSMFLAGIINLIGWPFSIYHIFFGYRGTEALKNLELSNTLEKFSTGLRLIFHMVFLDSIILLLLFCIIIGLGLLLKLDIINRIFIKKNGLYAKLEYLIGENWMFVCVPTLLYGMMVFKVAPHVTDRYIMCLFPLIYMLIAICITNVLSVVCNKSWKKWGCFILGCIGISYAVLSCLLIKPEYLYLERKGMTLGVNIEKAEVNCLMIGDDDQRGFPEVVRLSEFKQVMVIGEKEIMRLYESQPKDKDRALIVYLQTELNQKSILEEVADALSLQALKGDEETTSDITGFRAYYFSKN